jgi:hypothetical protein
MSIDDMDSLYDRADFIDDLIHEHAEFKHVCMDGKYSLLVECVYGYRSFVDSTNTGSRKLYDKEILKILKTIVPSYIAQYVLSIIHPKHKKYFKIPTTMHMYDCSIFGMYRHHDRSRAAAYEEAIKYIDYILAE